MKRKGLLYLATAVAILVLVNLAYALIPPPPVNQDLGLTDTVFGNFTEAECRECHSSGVPDRHHLLVENEGYNCTDCHPVVNGSAVDLVRDCLACHASSPHHLTQAAQDRLCSQCHGSFVDDYNDGHTIATYTPSLVTPATSYTVIDNTTTPAKKIGGCEACHEPDAAMNPPIRSNPDTHHSLTGISDKCDICHGTGGNLLDIRKCEDCHGIKSLHNIQYNYDNTTGQLGYGHIGANWDCWGCHGWADIYSSAITAAGTDQSVKAFSLAAKTNEAPQSGPIIPQIDDITPNKTLPGVSTKLTITGSNFVNTYNGHEYTSVVTVEKDGNTITIEPDKDKITASQIEVTLPPLEQGTWLVRAVKDGSTISNPVDLSVMSKELQDQIGTRAKALDTTSDVKAKLTDRTKIVR